MNTPNIENKVIFHDWQPRELQALIRATAVLQSKQKQDDIATKPPVLRSKHIARRRKP